MKMNESDSLVLTPTETAELLRIGRGTAYEQIRLGVIPSIRIGRRILVPRVALMKMLETAKGKETHHTE
jgi:excisionase family DNA binding protein